jgi:outer membrane biosynthesis protein TonB
MIGPALAISLTAQGAALIVFEVTRPEQIPALTVRFEGEGEGSVLITKVGETSPLARCDKRCQVVIPAGTAISIDAIPSEGATFGGFHPYPVRPPPALVPYLGDPSAPCLADAAVPADGAPVADPLHCQTAIVADSSLVVEFGRVPEQVDVALLPELDKLAEPARPKRPKPPAAIDGEKLTEDKAVEVALVPPQKMPEVPPPPPPEQTPPAPAKPPEPPPPNLTAVEVPDQNEVEKAPDDAAFMSDKNRDVAEETRAKDTNLDKQQDGKVAASEQTDDTTSPDIGGATEQIRQLEKAEATTDEREKDTTHNGADSEAKGVKSGDQGDNGDEGTGERSDPGLLAMREVGGRGSFTERKNGDGRKQGKAGLPGINSPLAFEDYQRIIGKDKVEDERQVAARKLSMKKGRWERKLEALRSTLENFTPDIRTGNQTALKTRAQPFAVYLARMHRRIHELWGFGFLEFLDGKGSDYPLNNFELWTDIELAINPDGTVFKATIAKTSGNLEFDVAAVDTMISAAPFEATPEVIRSVDQRVYLRWGFYRDWRQCGTFNAHPFILTDIPGGIVPIEGDVAAKAASGDKPVTPQESPKESTQRSTSASQKTSVTDAKALFAANMWVSGFSAASVIKMEKHTALPFTVGGKPAANSRAELDDMYGGLLVESGALKDWQLLTAEEYAQKGGTPMQLAAGDLVISVRTSKERFALALRRTGSGDYLAYQLVR